MKIIAICESNYQASIEASKFVFGEVNWTATYNLHQMLPTSYYAGASFHIKWHGCRLKFGYHVNGKVYVYTYKK